MVEFEPVQFFCEFYLSSNVIFFKCDAHGCTQNGLQFLKPVLIENMFLFLFEKTLRRQMSNVSVRIKTLTSLIILIGTFGNIEINEYLQFYDK